MGGDKEEFDAIFSTGSGELLKLVHSKSGKTFIVNKKTGKFEEETIKDRYAEQERLMNIVVDDRYKPGVVIEPDRKVRINFFKGDEAITGFISDMNSIKYMNVLLKIEIVTPQETLKKYIPMDAYVSKEIIESVSIDFSLIELFLSKKFDKNVVIGMLSHTRSMYKVAKSGQHLGFIVIRYDIYTEFVNYITYLSYEPFKHANGADIL